jgi:hypothetical protein
LRTNMHERVESVAHRCFMLIIVFTHFIAVFCEKCITEIPEFDYYL